MNLFDLSGKKALVTGGAVGIGRGYAVALAHAGADMIRATMEGIALSLRLVLGEFRELTHVRTSMNVVGGGALSEFWRQIYADVFRIDIEKINIGQDAAALGAAALAAVGAGLWSDFSRIDSVLHVEDCRKPRQENVEIYNRVLQRFSSDARFLAER